MTREKLTKRYRDSIVKLYSTWAQDLYNGGWRSKDRNKLTNEFKLTGYETDKICKILFEIELVEIARGK